MKVDISMSARYNTYFIFYRLRHQSHPNLLQNEIIFEERLRPSFDCMCTCIYESKAIST